MHVPVNMYYAELNTFFSFLFKKGGGGVKKGEKKVLLSVFCSFQCFVKYYTKLKDLVMRSLRVCEDLKIEQEYSQERTFSNLAP